MQLYLILSAVIVLLMGVIFLKHREISKTAIKELCLLPEKSILLTLLTLAKKIITVTKNISREFDYSSITGVYETEKNTFFLKLQFNLFF